jgi:hypothetical protein
MKNTLLFLFLLIFSLKLTAQVPFNTSPVWISTDPQNYSTGCAWADINRDGRLDFVVANGNDMAREKVVVYYNTGSGTFLPTLPSWQSGDIDYHGQLSIGDVNKDGYPDVAVSVYIGAAGFSQKGRVKLYLNNSGTLNSAPSWVSEDTLYTFSCAFGDADGDGNPDLAVATGESYNSKPDYDRIYFNNNGVLAVLPGWKSKYLGYSMDVTWADFNGDGRLDLVFAGERGPSRMYLNYGDSIGTVPYWMSADAGINNNSLFAGDVNNDGMIDLAVSENNQLGGTGKFKIYLNTGITLSTTPFWSSAFSGYGSGISLADIDQDGDLDLTTGGWWQPCRIYLNQSGTFNVNPQWTSVTGSVVETIVFGDYDNDGLDSLTNQFTSSGTKKLFYLTKKPFHKIIKIYFGADSVSANQYCYDAENGWISFASAPPNGTIISIRYIASHDLDFAVSNWDASLGNYVFKNNIIVNIPPAEEQFPNDFFLSQNYPNPFNPSTAIRYSIPRRGEVKLTVFDVTGREAATLVNEKQSAGTYQVTFNGSAFTSGVYFYRLTAGDFSDTKKLLLIK